MQVIEFHLETRSGVPTYLQIVQQVRQAVRLGVLRPGDQLPTVKDVVGTLTVNPNTVLKAYRDLDREGLVEGRRGVGATRRDPVDWCPDRPRRHPLPGPVARPASRPARAVPPRPGRLPERAVDEGRPAQRPRAGDGRRHDHQRPGLRLD